MRGGNGLLCKQSHGRSAACGWRAAGGHSGSARRHGGWGPWVRPLCGLASPRREAACRSSSRRRRWSWSSSPATPTLRASMPCWTALAAQDYAEPAGVLVIDAGSAADPSRRRGRRPARRPGAAAATTTRASGPRPTACSTSSRAPSCSCSATTTWCPSPTRVPPLVEVAEDYDAGVVGPKLVALGRPRAACCRSAWPATGWARCCRSSSRGELDQAQHDGVREVFVVPGAFTLVRAELFERIGGFDEAITFMGDDLSLCWRARLAGARVLVTSDARVRHAEALGERAAARGRRRQQLADRHRLRTLLMCTRLPGLPLALPRAALVTLFQVAGALLIGRGGRAVDAAAAWPWNVRRAAFAAGRPPPRGRRAHGRRPRRPQGPGAGARRASPAAAAPRRRGPGGPADDEDALGLDRPHGRRLGGAWRRAPVRQPPPASPGTCPPSASWCRFGDHPSQMVAEWASGWRHVGLGQAVAAPTIVGLLGGLGALLVGADLLRTLLTVGLIPVGIVGAHRLLRPVGLQRVQVVAALAYAAAPIPYNALAQRPLVGAGGLRRRAVAAGPPGGRPAGGALRPVDAPLYAPRRHPLGCTSWPSAWSPGSSGCWCRRHRCSRCSSAPGWLLGSLLAGERAASRRLAVATVGGALVGLLLHLPDHARPRRPPGPHRGVAGRRAHGRPVGPRPAAVRHGLVRLRAARLRAGGRRAVPAAGGPGLAPGLGGPGLGRGAGLLGPGAGPAAGLGRRAAAAARRAAGPGGRRAGHGRGPGCGRLRADVRGRSYRFGFRRLAAVVGRGGVRLRAGAAAGGLGRRLVGHAAGRLRRAAAVRRARHRRGAVADPVGRRPRRDARRRRHPVARRPDLRRRRSRAGRTVRDLWPGDGGATPRLGRGPRPGRRRADRPPRPAAVADGGAVHRRAAAPAPSPFSIRERGASRPAHRRRWAPSSTCSRCRSTRASSCTATRR